MRRPEHAARKLQATPRAIFLAIPLPPLARRPRVPPVTTPLPHSAPRRRAGSDRRQARRTRAFAGRATRSDASHRLQPSHRSERAARGHHLRTIGEGRGGGGPSATRARMRSGSREAGRMGGAWHRCVRNSRLCRRCGLSRASSGGSATRRSCRSPAIDLLQYFRSQKRQSCHGRQLFEPAERLAVAVEEPRHEGNAVDVGTGDRPRPASP